MGVDDLLFEQLGIECAESVEHVAAHMNEVVDADSLEIISASGSTGNDEFCTAVEILERCGCKLCLLVIA